MSCCSELLGRAYALFSWPVMNWHERSWLHRQVVCFAICDNRLVQSILHFVPCSAGMCASQCCVWVSLLGTHCCGMQECTTARNVAAIMVYEPKQAKNMCFLHFLKQPVDGFQYKIPVVHPQYIPYEVSRVWKQSIKESISSHTDNSYYRYCLNL